MFLSLCLSYLVLLERLPDTGEVRVERGHRVQLTNEVLQTTWRKKEMRERREERRKERREEREEEGREKREERREKREERRKSETENKERWYSFSLFLSPYQ
jgi:hypothetical protein